MTPHSASNGRGSFLLDRVFPGVGRIHRASGTRDGRTFRAMNAMLDRLYDLGRLDTLRAMRTGDLKPLQAYNLFRTGELERLPDVKTVASLEESWSTWQQRPGPKQTQMGRKYAWNRLKEYLHKGATLSDLPAALLAVRDDYGDRAVAYNRTRAAVLAFLRDKVTQRHQLYIECKAIPAMSEQKKERSAPTITRAILAREALGGVAGAMWWSMYLGGMGPDEYDLAWEENAQVLSVPGTKRKARARSLPAFGPMVRRAMGWKQYREALTALPKEIRVQPYDARRGFFHLLEESGITRTRRKMYGGHAVGDVTGGYERAELAAFMKSDRELVRARLAIEEQQVEADRRPKLKKA